MEALPNLDHYRRREERPFLRPERERTTLLFGGLTHRIDRLMQGSLEAMGYQAHALSTPNLRSYELGREFGNTGQCNPTYFTVGNLVKYLAELEASGMSREEISDRHVFFTTGACGPCRFGMYEAEYRLALENAGFPDFRVLVLGKDAGLRNGAAKSEAGLDMNLEVYLGILNAINLGDVLNNFANQVRPYEINPGETNQVLEEVLGDLYEAVRVDRVSARRDLASLAERWPKLAVYLWFFQNRRCLEVLRSAAERIRTIRVDRTRCKPVVKIVGEFWAQITEGDGNFNMFSFLEKEGAEVVAEGVTSFLFHLMEETKTERGDTKDLYRFNRENGRSNFRKRLRTELKHKKVVGLINLMEGLFNRRYNALRETLGGVPHAITKQAKLTPLASPYFRPFVGGGEVHLEVAKNIYYQTNGLVHMVLSLKPFGCLPSTQSDGIQSAVVSHYDQLLFLPVETAGDGEINAHSRVQMVLGEAKRRARDEYDRTLQSTGFTLERIRAYMNTHPELSDPLYSFPRRPGITGTGANFLLHVSERMRDGGIHP